MGVFGGLRPPNTPISSHLLANSNDPIFYGLRSNRFSVQWVLTNMIRFEAILQFVPN